jgi:hypothetical protein
MEIYRSRSPLTFPSKRFKKDRRNREVGQVLKVNNGGERRGTSNTPKEEEGSLIYPHPTSYSYLGSPRSDYPPQNRIIHP